MSPKSTRPSSRSMTDPVTVVSVKYPARLPPGGGKPSTSSNRLTSVTVMANSWTSLPPLPSLASTSTTYRLSPSASAGASKSGELANPRVPFAASTTNAPASGPPASANVTGSLSGSSAASVWTVPVPFSGNVDEAAEVKAGGLLPPSSPLSSPSSSSSSSSPPSSPPPPPAPLPPLSTGGFAG